MDAAAGRDRGDRRCGEGKQALLLEAAPQGEASVTNSTHAPLRRYAYDPLGVRTFGWCMEQRHAGESYPPMYVALDDAASERRSPPA